MKLPPKKKIERGVYKRKKLVYGFGINDADYVIDKREIINGKRVVVWKCPFYTSWSGMLQRCYSEAYHHKKPTYRGCKVCDEWLIFSNFKRWMEQQDWQGKHLDKDLLVTGNKVYSPDTCVFIHRKINSFVTDNSSVRGQYMVGVCWFKQYNKFRADCHNPFTGKQDYLGLFTDELEAHLAWKAKKHEFACQLADSEYVTDERLANALRTRYNEQSDWTNK